MTLQHQPHPTPKVSIGMPVYNGEKYIRETLDSLLAQTFTDFELIISDNASTDGTGAICQEYAATDRRIRYIRQSENRGYIANFHFVLKEAAGEYFMWAAADDRWDAKWIAALVKRLDPGVAIAFGSFADFQNDGRQGPRTTLKSISGPGTVRMVRFFLWNNSQCHKGYVFYGLYRTAELRSIGGAVLAPADDRLGFDNILVFAMLQAGSLHIEPGVTFHKRTRPAFGLHQVAGGMFQKWRRMGPYTLEYIRRSPDVLTRCALLAAMPIKSAWQIWRGFRRVGILLFRSVMRKELSVGRL